MQTFAERFQAAMDMRGVKQADVVNGTKIGKSSISTYLSGEYEPKQRNVYKIAKFLNVDEGWLMGFDVPMERKEKSTKSNITTFTPPEHTLVNFPVVGSISAGYTGVAAEEYTGEYVPITLAALHGPLDEYFVLRVSGDSMYPYLLNGDLVLVHRTTIVENGKVAVVLYNGDEATIKRVNYKVGEYIELVPNNPEYKTRRIQGEDLNECRIIGEVIKLMRDVL